METVGVPRDSYVLKTKAYKFILKVRKFQLPTVYSFSTAEGETWLWVDSDPPPCLIGLKKAFDTVQHQILLQKLQHYMEFE